MNLSYNWLKELVNFALTPAELAEKLNQVGCAVEALEVLPNGDTRLVAEITSNRGDWLGHFGVAREIAAILGKTVNFPAVKFAEKNIGEIISVSVERPDLCPRYVARVIKGVKIAPSPQWLQDKLIAVGLRPLNNIVDITNLLLYECAQPLHAFDLNLLAGKKISVRLARAGEKMRAITGGDCLLDSSMLVIADENKPVAVAGVMGGANSEVHDRTTDILLETAAFAPTSVRATGRKLKLTSDSSYRFERGVDVDNLDVISQRASALIQEIAGGEIYGVIDVYPQKFSASSITLRYAACNDLLGYTVTPPEIAAIFTGLGLEKIHADADSITVRVPTFRRDLEREVDLIEEVVRLSGFDRVPSETYQMPLYPMSEAKIYRQERTARETLARLGYHESVTDSFVPAAWSNEVKNSARIENPVDSGRPFLRQTLLASLLDKRARNRAEKNLGWFEMNTTYRENPRSEKFCLALIDDRGMDFIRGALEEVVRALRLTATLAVRKIAADENGAAEIYVGTTLIGKLAMTTPAQQKLHDLETPVALGEIDFALLAATPTNDRVFTPLPRFPGIRRDLALVVPEAVTWEEILTAANVCQKLDYRVESIYRGKGIEAGKKSVAFTFTYFAPDKTLTDDEANARRNELLAHLLQKISGAQLR